MSSFYPLQVTEVRRETPDCVSVALLPAPEVRAFFKFEAGQYLTLRTKIDGEEVRRSYSLCVAPHEGEWRVAIKAVPGGKFSGFANRDLQVGDVLEAMPPQGRFVLPARGGAKRNFVGIAAGSGITPILGLVRETLESEPDSSFTLFYGNQDTQHIIFREVLQDLKDRFLGRFSLHFFLTREPVEAPLFHGRIDGARLQKLRDAGFWAAETTNRFFLCGPESMILGCKEALLQAGVEESAIQFELFTTSGAGKAASAGPSVEVASGSGPIPVSIVLDGLTTEVKVQEGKTIMDAALDAGLDVPYSCLGGVCCTCRAKMTSGRAQMAINYALEQREVEQGFVLTCQSRPVGAGPFVVDFDQQ
jgi:ring-1,2-phenylacetyl-CoA epoxidase subunit PaaE